MRPCHHTRNRGDFRYPSQRTGSVEHCRQGRHLQRIRYGTVLDNDGETVDNVLVSVFRAPHSYTGEDSAEISCHASGYIVQTIIGLLLDAGARSAGPGEFTRRAFVNGKMDLAQAEAVADVIAAQDKAAHRVAMNQLKGGYSKELGKLRAKLRERKSKTNTKRMYGKCYETFSTIRSRIIRSKTNKSKI